MLDVRFRPLPKWPDTKQLLYKRDQFKTSVPKTYDLLEYELGRLKASNIMIEAGFVLADIRNDGWPKGAAKPQHPGIVLYCKAEGRDMRMPCATYARWTANIHAIALTLEALRAIDRYGVTTEHQQYIGFAALPPPGGMLPAHVDKWTLDEAATWLAARTTWVSNGAQLLSDYASFRRAYREAAAKLHPESGGSMELFKALQDVNRLMEDHYERKKP